MVAAKNQVRIIGGTWRSRVIAFAPRADLRPTPDRVRETLFNWLGQDLTGWRVLDAFAGSGALEHLVEGIRIGGADAVLAASIFHYGEYTVAQAKARMAERGIAVRL